MVDAEESDPLYLVNTKDNDSPVPGRRLGERPPCPRGGGGDTHIYVLTYIQIHIQNNFIDTVHIINTYWVISSIK